MSITIKIESDLEEKLRESARKAGMSFDHYIVKLLEENTQLDAIEVDAKEKRERFLLEKINLGIPVSIWKRYNYLKSLREKEQLEPDEHSELISISDQIEQANADRMKYLMELADLRQVSIESLMESLGINAGSNV